MAANWRALPPVMMEIGPVLHVDDVVAGKMSALYTRAEPRDFLDVDAAIISGRYTGRGCVSWPNRPMPDSTAASWLDLFAMLERYPDRRFAAYGADPAHIAAMRERFAQWRELITDQS